MHIPDGLLSNHVTAICFAASAGALFACDRIVSREPDDGAMASAGAVTAFVFAAQMINFPIGFGASGHFLGAFFLAMLLGPCRGYISMAVILAIQALFFADGGVVTFGANLFNMGIAGCLVPYWFFASVKNTIPLARTRSGFIALAAISSYLSVVASSLACGVELGISGVAPMRTVVPAITFIHAFIAIGEAAIVSAMTALIIKLRPAALARHAIRERHPAEGEERCA